MQRKLIQANSLNLQKFPTLFKKLNVRFMQSPKNHKHPGFLDSLIGAYEDPRFRIDLKPLEFRDGQFKYYYSHRLGTQILAFVCAIPFVLAFFSLTFYSLYDSEITYFGFLKSRLFDRTNLHPRLKINNDVDRRRELSPIYSRIAPWGMTQASLRDLFYLEIEDALEERGLIKNK